MRAKRTKPNANRRSAVKGQMAGGRSQDIGNAFGSGHGQPDRTAVQPGHFRQGLVVRPECNAKLQRGRANNGVGQLQLVDSPKFHRTGANRWSQFAHDKLLEKLANFLFLRS